MCSPSGRLLLVDDVPGVDELPDIEYTDEMGLNHADFFRLIPSAMGDNPHRIDGMTVHGEINNGTVEITLGAQQERRIALMRIPYALVRFHFRGVTEAEHEAFKTYFDLRFQRGGG